MTKDLAELVEHACSRDINRLMLLILTMNSTVRHFKTANKLLLELLRQQKIRGLMKLNHRFTLPQFNEEMDPKETDL